MAAKARPRLQLKPRSKPVEETKPAAPVESRKSIFGDAKPVDTTAKEREIEQKLEKLKVETDLKKDEQKGEHDYRSQRDTSHSNEGEFRSRKDSGRSSEGEFRSRKDSGRSNEGEFRSRKDSGRSSEGEKSVEKEGTAIDQEGMQDKSVPPPPVVNVWKQRMDAQKTTVTSDKGKDDTSSESITRKLSSERTPEKKAVSPNGPTSPMGRGSNPRQQNRSERGGGTRGRDSGENQGRTIETGDGGSKEERKDRREKKSPEFKKCDDQPPVSKLDYLFLLIPDVTAHFFLIFFYQTSLNICHYNL
jgi:translation initiation factor 4B